MVGVYTTALDEVRAGGTAVADAFEPKYHAFYADRLYDITDGKPKFVDMAVESAVVRIRHRVALPGR